MSALQFTTVLLIGVFASAVFALASFSSMRVKSKPDSGIAIWAVTIMRRVLMSVVSGRASRNVRNSISPSLRQCPRPDAKTGAIASQSTGFNVSAALNGRASDGSWSSGTLLSDGRYPLCNHDGATGSTVRVIRRQGES